MADDDPRLRELVRYTLVRAGFRVREAADGLAALQAFALHGLFLDGQINFMRAKGNAENVYYGLDDFKHFTGEFPTASALALWLACMFLNSEKNPTHFIKRYIQKSPPKNILIYNTYRGEQHSFMLVSKQKQFR